MHRHAAIAAVASTQLGLITSAQLQSLGVSYSAVSRMVKTGKLHVIHRRVYAVGHVALSREARWLAVVLAAGEGAALSHVSAAQLWGITRRATRRAHVTTPRKRRPIPGAVLTVFPRVEACTVRGPAGVPVTSATRTVADLARCCGSHELTNVMYEAEYRDLLDHGALDRIVEHERCLPGRARLVDAISMLRSGSAGSRSRLEEHVRQQLHMSDPALPEPLVNVLVPTREGPVEVDLWWPRFALCVEVDGPGHRRARARRADAVRDRRLAAVGMTTIRIDGEAFTADPVTAIEPVLRHIAALGGA